MDPVGYYERGAAEVLLQEDRGEACAVRRKRLWSSRMHPSHEKITEAQRVVTGHGMAQEASSLGRRLGGRSAAGGGSVRRSAQNMSRRKPRLDKRIGGGEGVQSKRNNVQ